MSAKLTYAIAAIVAVIGITTLQTISMLSVQSASAQPPLNQGQCQKIFEEGGSTKQEAHEICKEGFILTQGECIQFSREHPEFITKEECKFQF